MEQPQETVTPEPELEAELNEIHEPLPQSSPELEPSTTLTDYDGLKEMARQAIEEVAWEVLPDLVAEVVRSELERATREGK